MYTFPRKMWLASALRILVLLGGVALFGPVVASQGPLKTPEKGTLLTWTCTGPYSQVYELRVKSIVDGVVRYEGALDGERGRRTSEPYQE